jgi:peptide chain release factor subunit 3
VDKTELIERAIGPDCTRPDRRPPINIVFVGHVDSGKSTICGKILILQSRIDQRTIEKYEEEAKILNRETWSLAYVMDINLEERERGKTLETGRSYFETPNKRFTILDAPGHRAHLPNMVVGTT